MSRKPLAYLGAVDGTTSTKGVVELATAAEAVTGSSATKAATPAGIAAAFAAPKALGSGTPAAVTATTVTGSALASTGTVSVKGGTATSSLGTTALVAGTKDILNTSIAATDRVFVTRSSKNSSTALGVFEVIIDAGVKFTINSLKVSDGNLETNDVSIVSFFVVRQTA
jgi:hypothetical protein